MLHDHYAESGDASQSKVLQITHAAASNLPAQVAQLLQSGWFQAQSGIKSVPDPHNAGASSSYKHSNSGSVNSGDTDPNSLSDLHRGTRRNRFVAVRVAVPLVPVDTNAQLTATAPGQQTAIVIALVGE